MGTTIALILIIGGGAYFSYWAIQRTLREDEKPQRNTKKTNKKQ